MTHDWRVRMAASRASLAATNLGFVAISDDSIQAVLDGMGGQLPYQFGLYWPRQVYGRLVNELAAQGAAVVGFDILFPELRPDPPVQTSNGPVVSDAFFAAEIRQAGNVILAAVHGLPPHELFRAHALGVADISAHHDADGILRRAKAFEDLYLWHPLIKDAGRLLEWDLSAAQIGPERVVIPVAGGGQRVLALTNGNQFNQLLLFKELREKIEGAAAGQPLPEVEAWSPAFTRLRCWQLGLVLAARSLGLDLDRAQVDLPRSRIVLTGDSGVMRTIPVDAEGRFLIDWQMTPYDPALTKEPIESLLLQYELRQAGQTAQLTNRWRDKLVIVGSTATGNDLTDLGATPLERETYLLSQQWNVANSLLTGRFVRIPSLPVELGIILLLGALSGWLTWNLRVLAGNACVLLSAALYLGGAVWLYAQWRWSVPIVLPVGGALLVLHASLVTYRVLHEQAERRRVTHVFGRIVSPSVRDELLDAPQLALGGVRREITVMFADICGFTAITDESQARAEEFVRRKGLPGTQAQQHFEQQAQEVLQTVNLCLGLIADTVKQFDGTLDKYIGDCVMAFWGAPAPNARHASACVRAMIEAQRAIQRLNQDRTAENLRRESENARRAARGEDPLPLLPLLAVGIGINTGMAIVGLVGSEAHILNYTAFGREVNVASRIEQVAGAGRIVVTEAARLALVRDDAVLGASCVAMPPVLLKGIQAPVNCFEVPWQSHPGDAAKA